MKEHSADGSGSEGREGANEPIERKGIIALMVKGILSGALVIGTVGCAFTKDHTFIDDIKKYIHDASVSISEAIKGKEQKVVSEDLSLSEDVHTITFGKIRINLYTHKHTGGLPNEYFVDLELDMNSMQPNSEEVHIFVGEEPVAHVERDEYRSPVTVATLRSPLFLKSNKWKLIQEPAGSVQLAFEVHEKMHALFFITDIPINLDTLSPAEGYQKNSALRNNGYFKSTPLNFQKDIADKYHFLPQDGTYSGAEYVIDLHPEKNRDAVGLRLDFGRSAELDLPKKMNIP